MWVYLESDMLELVTAALHTRASMRGPLLAMAKEYAQAFPNPEAVMLDVWRSDGGMGATNAKWVSRLTRGRRCN